MGKVPELDNFYVATGFLYGIAAGGGAGKMMAEWILEGRPSLDLWPLDVRRFAFHHTTHHFMGSRMVELYAHHYKLAAPGSEHVTSRGVKRSPLHDALAGARRRVRFARRMGAARLVRPATASSRSTSRRSPSRNWFQHVADEHRAVRERRRADRPDVVRQVRDHRARRARRRAVAVGRRHGQAARHGHLHAAVQRAGRDRVRPDDGTHRSRTHWYVVTGSAFGAHDMGWIRSQLPARRHRCRSATSRRRGA